MKRVIILILIVGVIVGVIIYTKSNSGVEIEQDEQSNNIIFSDTEFCSANTGSFIHIDEAIEIANQSECVKVGAVKKDCNCNEGTGTCWLDIEAEKPGCAPACVVNVETKEAEVNWRCTGLIQPE